MKRLTLLHPLLWAAYPVVFLYAHNLQELRLGSTLLPFAVTVTAVAIVANALKAVLRDSGRAALLTTWLVLGFFSYGHAYIWLEQQIGLRHRVLMPVWIIVMVAVGILIVRTRRRLDSLHGFAFTVALALLAMSTVTVVAANHAGLTQGHSTGQFALEDPALPAPPPGRAPPDIYYILLDAYGGEAALSKYFHFDNHEFLDGLERRGFFVARDSRANYMMTHLAMSASLNMTYVDSLTDRVGTDSRNLHVLSNLIEDNRVARMLRRIGYETTTIQSPADLSARDFPNLLLQTTLVSFWTNIRHHRRRILTAFAAIEQLGPSQRPRFVYAHVLCPHGPSVFGPKGEPVTGLEWKRAIGSSEAARARHIDQVRFTNMRVERIVDGILARSNTPPVIILQGDHGPVTGENMEHMTPGLLGQRAPILNAILLPGGPGQLPNDLSPVNNFRVVFDRVFGAGLPLLANETYYSHGRLPYRLMRVTDQVAP